MPEAVVWVKPHVRSKEWEKRNSVQSIGYKEISSRRFSEEKTFEENRWNINKTEELKKRKKIE